MIACHPFAPIELKIYGLNPDHEFLQQLPELKAIVGKAQSDNDLRVFGSDLSDELRFQKAFIGFNSDTLFVLQSGNNSTSQSAGKTVPKVQTLSLNALSDVELTDHAGLCLLKITHKEGLIQFPSSFSLHSGIEAFAEDLKATLRVLQGQAPIEKDEDFDPLEKPLAEEDEPTSTRTLLRLWRFARPYKWRLLVGFLLTLASTAATLVSPYITMPLLDDVLIPFQQGKELDKDLAIMYLGGFLLASIAAAILSWARSYLLALVSERIGSDLRNTTFKHMMSLSLDYYNNKRTGDLIARIGSETDRINLFLSVNALDFLTDVIMMIMTAAILISINVKLALLTLLPLPFIVWLIHLVRERLRAGFEKADRSWSEISNILTDTIPGIRVVKAFAQEKRETDRFEASNRHNLEVNDRMNKTWALFAPSVSFLTEIGVLIIWASGIWLVVGNEITVGVLTAFLAYISRFYARLDSMSRIVSATQRAAAGSKRIFDILDYRSSVPEPRNPVTPERLTGSLQIRDVSFRYGSRQVLNKVNLDIKAGEMIGLVGHSGSGKSTLVNILCRFYDVEEGAVFADGVDLRSMPLAFFRSHIGLVLQEPFLFFGTIAENIAYGKPNATREQIVHAARMAHAHEFILRLPHGYDSLVGERGQSLSGGERQRISIARALLIDPKFLILDEATSSVDSQTEKEIQKALDNLVHGRTTIAIAHRLSTLEKADRLVVMDRGRIVEVGNHNELMEAQGHYFRLYEAQQKLMREGRMYD